MSEPQAIYRIYDSDNPKDFIKENISEDGKVFASFEPKNKRAICFRTSEDNAEQLHIIECKDENEFRFHVNRWKLQLNK